MSSAKVIFVEAGHGKNVFGVKDVGAVGKINGKKVYERDFAVALAREVINILKSKEELNGCLVQGVGVESDANVVKKMSFVNYVIKENKLNPLDCFGIAIHMNASISSYANGFEVWHQRSQQSIPFAKSIVEAWHKYAINKLRPKPINNSANGRYKKFYIDDTKANYIIIETGFISNEEDAKAILNDILRAAEAIAHGIMNHLRTNNKLPNVQPTGDTQQN